MHNRMNQTPKPPPTFDSVYVTSTEAGEPVMIFTDHGHSLALRFDKRIPPERQNAILGNLVEEFF